MEGASQMRRGLIITIACFAGLALTAQAALAVSVHWKKGSPTFTDNGLTLTEAGTVSGVGGGDLLFQLSATGTPTADCVNPGSGEHRPPGHNPASVTTTGATPVPSSAFKNGNASYTTTTNPPTTPIPGAPECPSASWTENITAIAWTSATLTIRQDTNGDASTDPTNPALYEVTVFGPASCSFSPPTADGAVPSAGFTCP